LIFKEREAAAKMFATIEDTKVLEETAVLDKQERIRVRI
jgi:hypothetical protein